MLIINKILIAVLLGVALYTRNLPMFFGMLAAYIVGGMDARHDALVVVKKTLDLMKDIKKIIEDAEKENNKQKNHDE